MSVRSEARAWLERSAARDERLTGLLLQARWERGGNVVVSKLFAPGASRTGARSWWHRMPFDRVDRDGTLVLVCERRDGRGFHALGVPCAWLRERRSRMRQFGTQPATNLMISAEPEDEFVESQSGVDFRPWVVV